MIRDFHLADIFTLANGSCGTGAIFFAMDHVRQASLGKVYAAAAFIVLALAFDVLDGRIARWRHQASPMGRELDSLSDVISFGVAPAGLAFSVGMSGFWDVMVLLYFVACGISRLARYNITAETLAADAGKVTHFEGAPIPSSVLLVLGLCALAAAGRIDAGLPGGAVSIGPYDLHPVTLAFAVSGSLMISRTLKIPKP